MAIGAPEQAERVSRTWGREAGRHGDRGAGGCGGEAPVASADLFVFDCFIDGL